MNVIIQNGNIQPNDAKCLFLDEAVNLSTARDLQTLMVELGCYSSKSKAIKGGRAGPIPAGFTEFKATKTKKVWIWNPSE